MSANSIRPENIRIPDDPNRTLRVQGDLTLRDYFAAKAMAAMVITDMVPGAACEALLEAAEREGQDPVYRLAVNSYEIADAMLAARKP